MSLLSRLHTLFSPPPAVEDMELDTGFRWNQHARIMLAVVIVVLSAIVVAWILA